MPSTSTNVRDGPTRRQRALAAARAKALYDRLAKERQKRKPANSVVANLPEQTIGDARDLYDRQAKERMRMSEGQGKKGVANLPPLNAGKARDQAGKAFG